MLVGTENVVEETGLVGMRQWMEGAETMISFPIV